MAVFYNTNDTHNPNAYLTLGILDAARKIWGEDQIVLADTENLLSIAAGGRHKTLICLDGQRLDRGLLRRARPAFQSMLLWTFEDPFMQDLNAENAPLFNYVFTNDPGSVPAYGQVGYYLPLAASPLLEERKIRKAADLEYDLFFAGTMWPNRVTLLERIIDAFPSVRMKLVCPSNPYLPPLPEKIAQRALTRPVGHEAFIDFANASAVTLTMFRDYASHGDVGQLSGPGPRLFELGLAGTAQVMELPQRVGEEYFKTVGGISLARDSDEVIALIRGLLANPALRYREAEKAQKSVLAHHLYANRLQDIAEISGADFYVHPAPVQCDAVVKNRRLRVLMCTHSTLEAQAWGGVEVYQQLLVDLLGRNVEFFYWLRRDTQCRLLSAGRNEIERFDLQAAPWDECLCDASEERVFSDVIGQQNIDLVHFQHLGHHALSLPLIAKAAGAGVVFSVHDFWLVSDRYNLLSEEMKHSEEEYSTLLGLEASTSFSPPGAQACRRAFIARMLKSVDGFLFGTESSEKYICDLFPQIRSKRIMRAGIPAPERPFRIDGSREAGGERDQGPLKIVLMGNFLRTKGADTLLKVIRLASPRDFHFYLYGYIHPDYQEAVAALPSEKVTVFGRYEAGSLNGLDQYDVMLALSIWPETYCMALSEAWQNGLIPIASDIGAFRDRIEDGVNGFLVPPGRADRVLEKLYLLRSSPGLRKKIRQAIHSELWVSHQEYASALLGLYHDCAPKAELGMARLGLDVGRLHFLPHADWRKQAPPRHIFDADEQRDLHIELPVEIEDWSGIQGAHWYIDSLCHAPANKKSIEHFSGAADLQLSGWFFQPEIMSAGKLWACLLPLDAEAPVIFLDTHRVVREDIVEKFPNAPRRSGFMGQWAFRGKWCEGRYRIGLLNVVNGQAACISLPYQLGIREGRITDAALIPPSNEEILNDFMRISELDGECRGKRLPALSETPLFEVGGSDLPYFADAFSHVESASSEGAQSGALFLCGWGFARGLGRSGRMYAVLVPRREGGDFYPVRLSRFPRSDVRTFHADAPLCSGFRGYIRGWSGGEGETPPLDGWFDLALLNVIGQRFVLCATPLRAFFEKDRASLTDRTERSEEEEKQVEARLDEIRGVLTRQTFPG